MRKHQLYAVLFVYLVVCIPFNVHNGLVGKIPGWLAMLAVALNVVGAVVTARVYRRERSKWRR